ncbi:MAG: SDR family oxidoreductase [Rhodospirillaceae bacterium]|jgi:3-oxoacyl-[acyl-carrier protein] reductase|nr:SDR family oxidoreductase [Rhodospirillaceae bacterium]MBT3493905.1 SDR family oxidoreductase [Rhodospirillaceae bacterium]MBT3780774.1 SDR family oxidoreductase [Rhodospirillaceae bacterium]MBT3976201.1 SDR family oxidoreductase [Rhodospirillaceae bacterium]MBT4167358.1 SDR family oxidoreductase [Rhodospirillaceae bacterium]
MDLGLKGKKAMVTGGSRGIGRAIANRLAMEGADVAICARNGNEVAEAVAALQGMGVQATGSAVDVSDSPALKAWINSAANELGGLDILVPNVSAMASVDTDEAWQTAFEIDIMGTIHTVQAALPHLEKSEAGAIVTINSVAALQYFGGVRPYNTLKAALVNHMSNLAHELAPKGIRVNSVSPGTIYFKGGVWHTREVETPEIYKGALGLNPMGRMGTPEEVANATVFLCSPMASFISGTNLLVDGALTPSVQY